MKSDSMCVSGSRLVLLSASLRLQAAKMRCMSWQAMSAGVAASIDSQTLLALAVESLVPPLSVLNLAQLRIGVPRLELARRPREVHRVRVLSLELFGCFLDLLVGRVLRLRTAGEKSA